MSKTIDYKNKTKKCRKCEIIKSFDDFYKSGTSIHSWCKECEKMYRKEKAKKEVLEEIIEDYDEVDFVIQAQWNLEQANKEIERLNNIINELLKKIQFYKTTEWGLRGFEILEYFENILTGSDE